MILVRTALALALSLPFAAAAPAEPPAKKQVENPAYAAWASFKAGATAVYEQDAGVPGQKTRMAWKLVEVSAEKVVLELTMTTTMGDQSFALPPQRSEQPRLMEVAEPTQPPDGPKPDVKQGTASVTTPAGTFACKTVETYIEMAGVKSWSTAATSPEVPGGTVKMTSKTEVPGSPAATSSLVLVEVKKP